MVSYNQTTFVYGVTNDGIYVYNAESMTSSKIAEGQGNFNIDKIENNTISIDMKKQRVYTFDSLKIKIFENQKYKSGGKWGNEQL